MAMEYAVQRLEMGDVVLIDLPEQGGEVEAMVVRGIDRNETTVRVSLRVKGRDEFVRVASRRDGDGCPRPMIGRARLLPETADLLIVEAEPPLPALRAEHPD
jgi:hypothetical protein